MQDIFTETEAKTKICPLTYSIPEVRGSHGQGFREYGPWNCIASDCMAWRLAHKDAADGQERGYCGAFGVPRFT